MGISIQKEKEDSDVRVLHVTGTLTKQEFDEVRANAAKKLGFFDRVRLLVIAENFEGWERGADWGDSSFFSMHGWKIKKIAIVADPQWKAKFLAFTVAGLRRAPVEFFPTGQTDQARAWLISESE
jgi:hypothetical protein